MAEQKKRSIPELSVDTQELMRALDRLLPGETATYKSLSDIIGRDVQGQARGLLNSARNILLREEGKVLECVQKVGIKLLTRLEVPSVGRSTTARIRRMSQKTLRKLATVSGDNDLPPETLARLNFELSAFAIISKTMHEKTIAKLQTAMENKRLPLVKFLEALKENI